MDNSSNFINYVADRDSHDQYVWGSFTLIIGGGIGGCSIQTDHGTESGLSELRLHG